MHNKHKKHNSRARKGSNLNRRVPGVERKGKHSIIRSPNQVCPDEMETVLTYPSLFILSAGAATFVARRWTPNAAYDVDPTLGSTSTPGFAEWSALYTYYRVTGYEVILDMSNLETFPIAVFSCNTNTDLGTGGSSYYSYATNPYCKHVMLSGKGGIDKLRIRHKIDCAALLGSEALEQADSLRAPTGAVPADLLWYNLGLYGTANLTNGVYCSLQIKMRVRFYGRKENLTTFLSPTLSSIEAERQTEKGRRAQGVSPAAY